MENRGTRQSGQGTIPRRETPGGAPDSQTGRAVRGRGGRSWLGGGPGGGGGGGGVVMGVWHEVPSEAAAVRQA